MVKFPEAQARLFRNKFICKICKTAVRAENRFVLAGKIKCRKCQARKLRPVRKK
ncbi:MAG TPA: 50S ribosomal protein L40e [Candidatus Nanoarchaeia archaeon]|nr:50S ribosomal protein L40e [Candidatus Nanoarchaeia archaeon]